MKPSKKPTQRTYERNRPYIYVYNTLKFCREIGEYRRMQEFEKKWCDGYTDEEIF